MMEILKNTLFKSELSSDELSQIFDKLKKQYPGGEDPWGLNVDQACKSFSKILPLYEKYFKVRVFGSENIKDVPYMIVANHSGQIAIDGMLISTAFMRDINPPRIIRPMVERFFTSIPFIGNWAQEGGSVLGDRQNCIELLKRNQSILVFPEGVEGVSKSTKDFYKLQNFTKGFYKIAQKTKTSILPIAVVGAEEFFPYVHQAKSVAKKFRLPALPISPNYLPLPSPIDIIIGSPIEVSSNTSQEEVEKQVEAVKEEINKLLKTGLKNRRPFFANKKDL